MTHPDSPPAAASHDNSQVENPPIVPDDLDAFGVPDNDSTCLHLPEHIAPSSPSNSSDPSMLFSPHIARGKRTASLASMLSSMSSPQNSPSSSVRASLTPSNSIHNHHSRISASFQSALQLRELCRATSGAHDSAISLIPFLPKLPQHTETRDNLVVPAYTRVYEAHGPDAVTRSWLYTRDSSVRYTPLENSNHAQPLQSYINPEELGFDPKQLERAMPVPPSSAFLASSIKLQPNATERTDASNSSSTASPGHTHSSSNDSSFLPSSETENPTRILHPETVGQLLRAFMIDSIHSDDDLVKYLRKFTATEDDETIAQHQSKAQSIFVKFLNSSSNKEAGSSKKSHDLSAQRRNADRLQASLSQKELTFLKLNQRDDLCLGHFPSLQLSTYVLNFSTSKDNPCNVGSTITSDFTIKNKKKLPVSCFVQPSMSNTPFYNIKVEPVKIELKKNQSAKITVSFTLKDFTPKINDFITLEIVGGARHFIALSVFCQPKPQFGVNAEETEMDYLEGFGEMPKVLIHLFRLYTSLHGRRRVGIFRRAGHETRMKQFKLQLNRGEYPITDDYNSVANLIKIWFRELPVKILDHFDAESLILIDAEDPEVCAQLLEEIPEPHRRLFKWLLALMADIAENAAENKMDPKNLAIVFSPNLYSSTVDNPAKIIMLTQKLSQVVCSLIKWFMENQLYPLVSAPLQGDEQIILDAEYLPPLKAENPKHQNLLTETETPWERGEMTSLVVEDEVSPPPSPPSDDDEPPPAPASERVSLRSLNTEDENPRFEEDLYADSNDSGGDGDDSESDELLGEPPIVTVSGGKMKSHVLDNDSLTSSEDTTFEELTDDEFETERRM